MGGQLRKHFVAGIGEDVLVKTVFDISGMNAGSGADLENARKSDFGPISRLYQSAAVAQDKSGEARAVVFTFVQRGRAFVTMDCHLARMPRSSLVLHRKFDPSSYPVFALAAAPLGRGSE